MNEGEFQTVQEQAAFNRGLEVGMNLADHFIELLRSPDGHFYMCQMKDYLRHRLIWRGKHSDRTLAPVGFELQEQAFEWHFRGPYGGYNDLKYWAERAEEVKEVPKQGLLFQP